ncbi:MAG: hypothetical protein J0H76_12985 [Sphingobacteriales bacterium]|nr:hypothetical protein [Sphingobacteriales bacterium]
MEQNQNLLNNELTIDPVAYAHLKETAMWARFLGILGFIMSGFVFLFALFAGSILSRVQQSAGPYAGAENPFLSMGTGFITVLYIVLAIISFVFSYLVYQFGNRTKKGLLNTDQDNLNSGFSNLKILFRIYGIIVIIYLAFIALALLFGIIGGLMK